MKGCSDPDPLVWQHSGKHLLSFGMNDFSGNVKSLIRQLLGKEKIKREIILVAGVANMQNEKNRFKKLLIDESKFESKPHVGKWYGTVGWAGRLALARLGSQDDIVHAIEMVESEPSSIIRVTRLLRDLAYIRQPRAIEALERYLNNDQRLPRVKATAPGTRFCQYALDLLAQILDGFPIESVGPGGDSQAEIDLCRQWMKEQREWKVKNPAPWGGVLY